MGAQLKKEKTEHNYFADTRTRSEAFKMRETLWTIKATHYFPEERKTNSQKQSRERKITICWFKLKKENEDREKEQVASNREDLKQKEKKQ